MVSVTKQFRIPVEELEEVERHRAATDDDFTRYVLESLRLRRSGQWEYGTNRLKDLNAKKKLIDFEKTLIKTNLHKLLLRRRARREKKFKGEEREVEEQAEYEYQKDLKDMQRIQDHLNGGTPIWICKNDPDGWLISDTDLGSDYRKLEKGKLSNELNEFYNENIHLLK